MSTTQGPRRVSAIQLAHMNVLTAIATVCVVWLLSIATYACFLVSRYLQLEASRLKKTAVVEVLLSLKEIIESMTNYLEKRHQAAHPIHGERVFCS